MARFTRWLMVSSVVASSIATPTAEACWLTGCCGGAPRTTYYAPAPAPCAPVCAPACPTPCATAMPTACEASPCNTCGTGVAATTFAQPTTALMPVTAYRPMFGWGRTQPVVATMPYTAGYAAAAPYSAGYTPYTAGYAPAPYTSYRPIALTQTSYAAPVSYTAPVTVQYAPQQPVAQATYYAPAAPTTTYMPTTTVAPVAAPAPGCNCHSSTSTGTTGQYWTPNSTTTVVQAAPITSGTTNGTAVMTSGSNSTFGNTNLGSQGVIQNAPQQTPANSSNNNVQPVEDPIKKSSNTVPSYEDPRNKTALAPLFSNSQVAETKTNSAPIVRSLDELAPYNPVRMTSNVR